VVKKPSAPSASSVLPAVMSLEVSLLGQRINISRADDADGADANPAFCFGESALASIILRRMAAASAISQSLEFSDVSSSSSTARDARARQGLMLAG
jgi:hypothetical protein